MHRLPTSYRSGGSVASDEFLTLSETHDDDVLPEYRAPLNWRLIAVLVVYGSLLFTIGLFLATME